VKLSAPLSFVFMEGVLLCEWLAAAAWVCARVAERLGAVGTPHTNIPVSTTRTPTPAAPVIPRGCFSEIFVASL
jgi:hypothetical protein